MHKKWYWQNKGREHFSLGFEYIQPKSWVSNSGDSGFVFFKGSIKDLRNKKNSKVMIKQNDLIKTMLRKSGIRCEILTNGKIFTGDKIKY